MQELESWKIIVISISSFLFVLCMSGIFYFIHYQRKNKKQQQDMESAHDEEKANVFIVDTTHERVVKVSEEPINEANLYGQQFAIVNPISTALSPPSKKHHHYQRQQTTIEKVLNEPITNNNPQELSLSPLESSVSSAHSPNSSNNSDSVSIQRPVSPFQSHHQTWRGPTPPWTQHPSR